jgi:nucleoside-diphosphate-sugar epimerase
MSINVVVLGAAGRTGRLIVAEALRNGHQVTAAVRTPASMPAASGLRVERADVRDADSLRAVITGHDAVVCAIGAPGRKADNLYSDGARATVAAMQTCGVKRLLAITSVGVRHDDPHHAWWYRSLIRPIGATATWTGPSYAPPTSRTASPPAVTGPPTTAHRKAAGASPTPTSRASSSKNSTRTAGLARHPAS